MSQELVVLHAARSAAGTIGEVIRIYRERRSIDASAIAQARRDVALIERAAHARNIAALARTNVNEIVKTQRLIDSMEPSGEAYWMCMENLRQLNEELVANLTSFSRGY